MSQKKIYYEQKDPEVITLRSIPKRHLPVVVGRTYQRRDGMIVVASEVTPGAGFGGDFICVAPEGISIKGADHVSRITGRVRAGIRLHPHDLILDVTGIRDRTNVSLPDRPPIELEFEAWAYRSRHLRASLSQEDGLYVSRTTRAAFEAYKAGRQAGINIAD